MNTTPSFCIAVAIILSIIGLAFADDDGKRDEREIISLHVLIFFAISTCNSNKILYMNIYIAPFSTNLYY